MYRLSYEEWLEQYIPQENRITTYGGMSNKKYETYGEDLDYIIKQDNKFVWTEMDSGEGISIVSGYHLVNRLNYFITAKPWTEDIEIPVCIDKECDCMSEGEGTIECNECDGSGYITIWIDTREELEQIYGA